MPTSTRQRVGARPAGLRRQQVRRRKEDRAVLPAVEAASSHLFRTQRRRVWSSTLLLT
jgi:hypothetical protein